MSDIRRKLFCLFDLALLFGAFLLTFPFVSFLQAHLPKLVSACEYCVLALTPNGPAPAHLPFQEYLWVFFFVAPVTILALEVLGAHKPIRDQHLLSMLFSSIAAPLVGTGILSVVLVVFQSPHYSRLFIVVFAVMCSLALLAARTIGLRWYRYTLKSGLHREGVAIVARPAVAVRLAHQITSSFSPDHAVIAGYFPLDAGCDDTQECALNNLGEVSQLRQMLNQEHIQRVVVALPSGNYEWLADLIKACEYFGVTVSVLPETLIESPPTGLSAQGREVFAQLPALTLAPPQAQADWLYVKRVVDVLVSGTVLLLLSPLMALIALIIKITTPSLPAFHRMSYVGRGGRPFHGYKFTTMIANAHKMQEQLASLNIMTGPVFKIVKDPRVTPFGRIIRKFDLNELPQLWNVFKGDMSLVGPRPTSAHELRKYDLWHRQRLNIQPGITCFWQVRGRNAISNFDDWVRMDLEYMERRSFWLDCQILARTALVVIRGTGS